MSNKEEADDEDEEDYMSDKFLQGENKPGLMPKIFLGRHQRKEAAKSNNLKKKPTTATKQQSTKVKEAENRKEKLNTALDESNKGFVMLARMGFKKGQGLGKEG